MKRNNRDFRSTEKGVSYNSTFFRQPSYNHLTTIFLAASLVLTHTTLNENGYSLIINGKVFHKVQPKTGTFNEKTGD